MKNFILNSWNGVMGNRHNPLKHLDLASHHFIKQVLGCTWSLVVSLSFLSIFQFGVTWVPHLLFIGGLALTVATLKEAEKRQQARELVPALSPAPALSRGAKSVWLLDKEA